MAAPGVLGDAGLAVPDNAERTSSSRVTGDELLGCVGYSVDAPEGFLGRVESVELAGNPPRPFALSVRALGTLRLVPAERIAQVRSDERRVLLWPDGRRLRRPAPSWA